MIAEEQSQREKFGFKKLPDETIKKLKTAPYSKDTELIGVMSYQILENPFYQRKFQYLPEILENRENLIVDDYVLNQLDQSDFVKKNISHFFVNNS